MDQAEQSKQELNHLLIDIDSIQETISDYEELSSYDPAVDKLLQLRHDIQHTYADVDALQELIQDIQRTEESIEGWEATLFNSQEIFDQEMPPVCPLCDAPDICPNCEQEIKGN